MLKTGIVISFCIRNGNEAAHRACYGNSSNETPNVINFSGQWLVVNVIKGPGRK